MHTGRAHVVHYMGLPHQVVFPGEKAPQFSAKPVCIEDSDTALRFLRHLDVDLCFWRRHLPAHIFYDAGLKARAHANTDLHYLYHAVAPCAVRGKIRFYRITPLEQQGHGIRGPKHTTLRFVRPAENGQEHKSFPRIPTPSKEAAEALVASLASDDATWERVLENNHLSGANAPSLPSHGGVQKRVVDALVKGDLAVYETPVSQSPKKDSAMEALEPVTGKSYRPIDAIAQTPAVTFSRNEEKEAKKEEKPKCVLSMVTVTASDEREAIINSKSKESPTLAVISTETKKKGMASISAEVTVNDICPNHKHGNFKVSAQHKIKEKTESKISLDVSCSPWHLNNVFERIWLPSVKPKTYRVTPKSTCEAPDISVRSINVDVYPAMKWHWETDINFGKLEFVPGKAKIAYSDLAIDGNVVLTYDGEEHNAKEKFDEYITKPMESFKKVCDGIAKVLEAINNPSSLMRIGTNAKKPPPPEGQDNTDGNETLLLVTWPNLSVGFDSTLEENPTPHLIDHDYSIRIAAKPLLDIDVQVDVLDTLMKVAPAGTGKLIEFAKERIEKGFETDDAKFRGELDIIFKAKTTVNIKSGKLSGKHNVLEHDVSGEPIKGDIDIPIELKGIAKVEGKWFFITFDIDYAIKGEAGWKGEFEFGKDEKGVYCTQCMEFTGIVVTFTKYGEVKAEVEIEASEEGQEMMGGFGGSVNAQAEGASAEITLDEGAIEGRAAKVVEKESVWTWLEPEKDKQKDSPERFYLVKH